MPAKWKSPTTMSLANRVTAVHGDDDDGNGIIALLAKWKSPTTMSLLVKLIDERRILLLFWQKDQIGLDRPVRPWDEVVTMMCFQTRLMVNCSKAKWDINKRKSTIYQPDLLSIDNTQYCLYHQTQINHVSTWSPEHRWFRRRPHRRQWKSNSACSPENSGRPHCLPWWSNCYIDIIVSLSGSPHSNTW